MVIGREQRIVGENQHIMGLLYLKTKPGKHGHMTVISHDLDMITSDLW